MKTKIQETYRCDFCNKLYLSKHWCKIHEERCFHNPINDRPCFKCNYLSKKDYDIEYEYGNDRTMKLFNCSKKDTYIYPPICGYRNNEFCITGENIPMPKECKDYLKTTW